MGTVTFALGAFYLNNNLGSLLPSIAIAGGVLATVDNAIDVFKDSSEMENIVEDVWCNIDKQLGMLDHSKEINGTILDLLPFLGEGGEVDIKKCEKFLEEEEVNHNGLLY